MKEKNQPLDPDDNISDQLDAAREILELEAHGEEPLGVALRLAELVLELDAALRRGGALPTAWER